jgi:hypothetical protein
MLPGTLPRSTRSTKVKSTKSKSVLNKGPLCANTVEKVENRGAPKIPRMWNVGDAARLCRTNTGVGGRFCVNRCGPSHRSACDARAVLRIFSHQPKKDFFNTIRQERSFVDNHHLRSKYFRTCDQGVEPPLDDGNESSDDFRCTPDSGHRRPARPCPKSAQYRK